MPLHIPNLLSLLLTIAPTTCTILPDLVPAFLSIYWRDNGPRPSDAPVPLAQLGAPGRGGCAAFSPDGRKILTASNNTASIWDAATFHELTPPLIHDDIIYTAQFSRDGAMAVTTSNDGTARVWDVATGEPHQALRHDGSPYPAAFSPDGSRVVTANARVWDTRSGRLLLTLRHDDGFHSAEFSPDGKRILTTDYHAARLWDAATGEPLRTLSIGDHDNSCPATFSPDGARVVTGNQVELVEFACVWETETGKLLAKTDPHSRRITSVTFSPDGKKFATTTDGYARVWDTATGVPLTPKLGDGVTLMHAADFSPDSALLVAVGESGRAKIWEVATAWEVLEICERNIPAYTGAAFSPDGKHLLTVTNGTALLWAVPSPEEIQKQKAE